MAAPAAAAVPRRCGSNDRPSLQGEQQQHGAGRIVPLQSAVAAVLQQRRQQQQQEALTPHRRKQTHQHWRPSLLRTKPRWA